MPSIRFFRCLRPGGVPGLARYGWLANSSDDATTWREEQFVLTPYLGRVIYLAWHYVYFSLDLLEPSPRSGWATEEETGGRVLWAGFLRYRREGRLRGMLATAQLSFC